VRSRVQYAEYLVVWLEQGDRESGGLPTPDTSQPRTNGGGRRKIWWARCFQSVGLTPGSRRAWARSRFVSARLLYLLTVRVFGWLVLLGTRSPPRRESTPLRSQRNHASVDALPEGFIRPVGVGGEIVVNVVRA
jgi:hypothetical protein